jgi:hypothetical protein
MSPRLPPLGLACLLLLVAVALAWALLGELRREPEAAPVAPRLPLSPPARCSVGPELAHLRALETRAEATARARRYPFEPSEGLRALSLLAESLACSPDPGAALEARLLARRVEGDYETRRARLLVARDRGDQARVAGHARWLRRLVGGIDPRYVAWLSRLEGRGTPRDSGGGGAGRAGG